MTRTTRGIMRGSIIRVSDLGLITNFRFAMFGQSIIVEMKVCN